MAVFSYLPPSPVFAVLSQFEGEVVSNDFVGKRHMCLLLWKLQEEALVWLLTTSQSPQRGSVCCVYGLPSVRLPGTQLCTAVAVATTKPGSFLGNAEALGALWCSNYGRLVVFQSGAPKAFGAYHMLLRSTHLSYGGFVGTDLRKSAGLSSKRGVFEDGLPIMAQKVVR